MQSLILRTSALVFLSILLSSALASADKIKAHSCKASDLGPDWRECKWEESSLTANVQANVLTCEQMEDAGDPICTEPSVHCKLKNVYYGRHCEQDVRGQGNSPIVCESLVACMNYYPGCLAACQGQPHGGWVIDN